MGKLLLLFIIVPAVELGLLIQVGIYLGTWPTLALIVFTGIVGAYLARRQGLSVLTTCAQEQMDRGELPASSLADGVMILVAGALLMATGDPHRRIRLLAARARLPQPHQRHLAGVLP